MKLKKAVAICGFFLVSLVIFMLYAAKDLTGFSAKKSVSEEFQEVVFFVHFQNKTTDNFVVVIYRINGFISKIASNN